MGELLAPVLKGAGTGLAVGGALQQGQAARQQGQAAEAQAISDENLAKFNAAVQKREATAIRQKSAFDSKRAAAEAHRRRGTQEVAGAKGGTAGSQVAEDLAAEQAQEDELEQLLIGFEGQVGAGKAERQGQLDLLSGKIARQRGKSAKSAAKIKSRASKIQAGASLLTGF